MSRVLVIGDTHCPTMHPKYVSHLKKIHKRYDCNKVVHIGDLVDYHAMSYHQGPLHLSNPQKEFKQAYKQVQQLYKAFPKVHWLTGNHDDLPRRRALDALIDADTHFKDEVDIYDIPGWKKYERYYDLIIDDVIYRHGDKCKGGQMAAHKNAMSEFQSVVQGHLHAQSGVVYHCNHLKRVFGMQVGCGSDYSHPQMGYARVYAQRPVYSCGVVLDGEIAIVEPMILKNKI